MAGEELDEDEADRQRGAEGDDSSQAEAVVGHSGAECTNDGADLVGIVEGAEPVCFDDVVALVLDTEVLLEGLYTHEGADDLPVQTLAERCEVDDQCP